jgi:integrase
VSIHKLASGRWQARIRVEGVSKKMTFDRKRDAEDWERTTLADARKGKYVDMLNKQTVAEYWETWANIRPVRTGTKNSYRSIRTIHLEPHPLGSRPLVQVRHSDVQGWVNTLAQTLAPYTVLLYAQLLKAVFTSAVHDGKVADNPVNIKLLAMPHVQRHNIIPLTVPQVRAWAAAVQPWVSGAIITQAALGLREGELRGLRSADVNFLRREVRIAAQLDDLGYRAPLKNSRRTPVRILPLPEIAAEAMAEQIRLRPNPDPDGPIFWGDPDIVAHRNRLRKARVAMAHNTWDSRDYAKQLKKGALAAGLAGHHQHRDPDFPQPGRKRGTEPSSHDLRHHFVSVMLGQGATIHEVADLIGDKPEAVLKTYGHIMPDRANVVRQFINDAWTEAPQAPRKAAGN